MVIYPVPVLVSVAPWGVLLVPTGWPPKATLAGERISVVPTPVRLAGRPPTTTGGVNGLKVGVTTLSTALRGPGAVGVKVTYTLQLALGCIGELQVVSATLKSALLPPLML